MTAAQELENLAYEIAGPWPLRYDPSGSGLAYALQGILELRADAELSSHQRAHYLQVDESFVYNLIARQSVTPAAGQPRGLYPEDSTHEGFLGWGEDLDEVIAADRKRLAAIGQTVSEVGLRLKAALDRPKAAAGLEIEVVALRQYAHCPLCGYENTDATFDIVRPETGDGIMGRDLTCHLMTTHDFCGGRRSPYRVEPNQLVKVLFD